jgi:hypothetical protein
MTFQTTLKLAGKTATGIQIPPEVIESLGSGKKPPVRVTINGHTYRSTVAPRGERYLVGVSADNRELAQVAAGDRLDVTVELDTQPRTIALPADLEAWLDDDALEFFDSLSYSQKRWYVEPVEQAKKPETRERRIARAAQMMRERRKR